MEFKNNDVTRSLAVPIGKNDQGETVLLDIHQKEDGPNGIIFGPAGSGKTEFINTFLISLAMNFSPDDIRFYLVDFNQTSGFDLLSKLPHMTGILVEEKKEAMQRFDRMLKEEFERREELLRQAGVSNAYQYLKKRKIRPAICRPCRIC